MRLADEEIAFVRDSHFPVKAVAAEGTCVDARAAPDADISIYHYHSVAGVFIACSRGTDRGTGRILNIRFKINISAKRIKVNIVSQKFYIQIIIGQ